jgi:hypothetical protein
MRNTEVRDTNIPHLAGSRQLLHLRPRLHIVPIRIMLIQVIWIRRRRPVHQVQVNIAGTQRLQGRVNSFCNTLVYMWSVTEWHVSWGKLTPRVVKLGGEPDFTPWDARVLDPTAYFRFVAVGKSGVDVTVAFAEGNFHSLLNLVGAGLPCSKTNCWDFVASVKSESLSVTKVLSIERLPSLGHVEGFNDGRMLLEGNCAETGFHFHLLGMLKSGHVCSSVQDTCAELI